MRSILLISLSLALFCSLSNGRIFKSIIPDEDWGYSLLDSSTNSNMFWWLYGAQNVQRDSLPFVIWLQGGPGASSLFGDFLEIGPMDNNLTKRSTTWVNHANIIFLDNPIGTGWSYTTSDQGYSTTDAQISANLVKFLQNFVQLYPLASTNPFWIFSESYGGKMASNFGVAIHNAVAAGKLKLNLKGISIGDGWVAPVECMKTYGQFLETQGLVDGKEREQLDKYALEAEMALKAGLGNAATNYWGQQQSRINQVTGGVNFYDFLKFSSTLPDITKLINGKIKDKLSQKVKFPAGLSWQSSNTVVFTKMSNEFMKPSISSVEFLLSKGYQVAVLSGQLDLIVDTLCINNWVENMNWSGSRGFFDSPHVPYLVNGVPSAAVKKYQNLQQWNVFKASHMIPMEAPVVAESIFKLILASK